MKLEINSLPILKILFLVVGLECLGWFYGPTQWLWLRSNLTLDPNSAHSYSVQLSQRLKKLSLYNKEDVSLYAEESEFAVPIVVFSTLTNKIQYWCSPTNSGHKLEKDTIILGEKGLLGRVGEKKGTIFEVHPLEQKNLSIAVLSEGLFTPLILTGDQVNLVGFDKTKKYSKHMLLYTLPNDSHYPPNYPVAVVKSVIEQDQHYIITAQTLDNIAKYNYAWVYKNKSGVDGVI